MLRPNETISNVAGFSIGTGVAGFSTVRFNWLSQQRALLTSSLQALVKEPHGCFEQTSLHALSHDLLSSLLLHHARQGRVFPRLWRFAPVGLRGGGGGYSWFGSKPATEPLTAYGLLEFQELLRLQEERGLLERRRRACCARR